MIKDKAYWQEYNRKRKEYLLQKQRERRKQVVDNPQVAIKESCIQPMNTTEAVVIKNKSDNDYNLNTTISDYNLNLTTTDYNSSMNTTSDYNQEKKVVDKMITTSKSIQPCSNCENLQSQVDNCQQRHQIPKEAQFINLLWDRNHKKLVLYSCSDSCWTGKYCNNCSALEQQLSNQIKQKNYETKIQLP